MFKHAVLSLCLEHLRTKPAPFRVIDVFAGVGVYDLESEPAQKTGEWRGGIGRLRDDPPADLAPYLGALASLNPAGGMRRYPGSPAIARHFLRAGDALALNELHAADHAALKAAMGGDRRVRIISIDGWQAVRSMLPPPERRGLVLIDPPFEKPGEFDRMARAVADIKKRFATGIALFWYPVKAAADGEAFVASARTAGFNTGLDMRMMIRSPMDPARLNGCGVTALNPPWRLEVAMDEIGPVLAARMADGAGARYAATSWSRSPGDQPLVSSFSS